MNQDGLRALFHPGSIALVGATDKSGWSRNTFDNLRDFPGPVHLVNPRGGTVHGAAAVAGLAAIDGPVDLAYVMVPTGAVLPVLREGAALGIRNYVVLTAGFGETGTAGAALEAEVRTFAETAGLTVLGPNGNGYLNAAAGITPYGLPVPAGLAGGPVGVVLQSGALASAILGFAQARNVGLSLLTSMGNEMLVSVTDVMEHLVDDPGTRVIALFLESVRRPAEFARVARKAAAAGKPVVAVKIGASRLASATARAHTGALVGDDHVVDAAFRQLGVRRVHSLEDLITTAALLADTPSVAGNRIGVVTPSGGASELIADRAEQLGLRLPPFAPETVDRLRALLPEFATVANPLDVTGYVVVDRLLLSKALEIVTRDPGLDAVVLLTDLPRAAPADPELSLSVYGTTSRIIAESPVPVVVLSNVLTDIGEFGREIQRRTGFPAVAGGIEHGLTALAGAVHRAAPAPELEPTPVPVPDGADGVWAEARAAAFLSGHGIPVVPSAFCRDAEAAVAAAERFGYPVVVKAAADGLGHKSELGGVRLDLRDADAVRTAATGVIGALAGRTGVGVLVQPHRTGGVELLAGVVRDPSWGPVLAVGLGGVWVEVLADTAQRLLPVDAAGVRAMLGELRGAAVLTGARGAEPADLDAVAAVIARIAGLAGALGERLDALEVNPLLVRGGHVEVLDALITWRGADPCR